MSTNTRQNSHHHYVVFHYVEIRIQTPYSRALTAQSGLYIPLGPVCIHHSHHLPVTFPFAKF